MVAATRPFFPLLSQSRRERVLEAHIAQLEALNARLGDKIELALSAWWSATEPRDDGTVGYTDKIEDAMDLIWEALGSAPAQVDGSAQ